VEDYPRTPGEFEARFATEEACRAFLVQARWSEGFRCPRCGCRDGLAGANRAVAMRGMWPPDIGDGGHDFSRYADAAVDLVSRDVLRHQQRLGSGSPHDR